MALTYTKPADYDIHVWAETATGSVAGPNAYTEGWNATTPPQFQFENFEQNRQDQFLSHINKYGIAAWDNATNYLTGSIVSYNTRVYVSKTANVNKIPTGNAADWSVIDDYIRPTVPASLGTIKEIAVTAGTSDALTLATKDQLGFANKDLSNIQPVAVTIDSIVGAGQQALGTENGDIITTNGNFVSTTGMVITNDVKMTKAVTTGTKDYVIVADNDGVMYRQASAIPVGTVVRTTTIELTGIAHASAAQGYYPFNAKPTVTDGTEIPGTNINLPPLTNGNKYRISLSGFFGSSAAALYAVALFVKGANTSDHVGSAEMHANASTYQFSCSYVVEGWDSSGNTTMSFRFNRVSTNFNLGWLTSSSGTSPYFGGAAKGLMTIEEIQV